MYIWQQSDWNPSEEEEQTGFPSPPAFSWQTDVLQAQLERVRLLQGRLLGQSDLVMPDADKQVHMDALIQSALRTSEIEGETLNVGSVRSPWYASWVWKKRVLYWVRLSPSRLKQKRW